MLNPVPFTHRELNRMYLAADKMAWPARDTVELWRLFIVVMYNLGLEFPVAMKLRWSDYIRVDYNGQGSLIVDYPQRGVHRIIPLNETVKRHLDAIVDKCQPNELIFGQFISLSHLESRWQTLLQMSDIQTPRRLTSFRAACAYHMEAHAPGRNYGAYLIGHHVNIGLGFQSEFAKAMRTLPQPASFTINFLQEA